MNGNCGKCKDIVDFEMYLDERSARLVKKVNDLCADVRNRNNERWEAFAKKARLPLFGNLFYETFRAPAGLEEEPRYYEEDWYRKEGGTIRKEASNLESLKVADLEHWGDEEVYIMIAGDTAGRYSPCGMFPRNVAYDDNSFNEAAKKGGWITQSNPVHRGELVVFSPDKYDFHSGGGIDKMQEGRFVMDSNTKKLVLFNRCNWSCSSLENSRFARSGCRYSFAG